MNTISNTNTAPYQQFYEQLITKYEPENKMMWCLMDPKPRPCFNPEILEELGKFLHVIRNQVNAVEHSESNSVIDFVTFGSFRPGIFSLGGDLELFVDLISENDRAGLDRYMRMSIQVMHDISINMHVPITTIALVRGSALGAGFEGALACDVIIAEKSVQLGFPEVLFNMFPGMGAYSFLARRIDPANVERMILSGRIYTAPEMAEMGIIDVLANDGEGIESLYQFLKKYKKVENTRKAIIKMRNRVNPVKIEEMIDIGEMWVDSALSLGSKDLRIMQRLIRSQNKALDKTILKREIIL